MKEEIRHRCARCARKRNEHSMEFKNGFWICKPFRRWYNNEGEDCQMKFGSKFYDRLSAIQQELTILVNGKIISSCELKLNARLIPDGLKTHIIYGHAETAADPGRKSDIEQTANQVGRNDRTGHRPGPRRSAGPKNLTAVKKANDQGRLPGKKKRRILKPNKK